MTTLALHFRRWMILNDPLYEQAGVVKALAPLKSNSPTAGKVAWQIAFWIPLPPGHKQRTRDGNRTSAVPDATPQELEAIRDGVIFEKTMEVLMPRETPGGVLHRLFTQAWENLTKSRAGVPLSVIRAQDPACAGQPLLLTGAMAAREFERRKLVIQP